VKNRISVGFFFVVDISSVQRKQFDEKAKVIFYHVPQGTFLFQFWFVYEIDFEKIDEILEFIPLNKPQLLVSVQFGHLNRYFG
jgi:hypothetical protein